MNHIHGLKVLQYKLQYIVFLNADYSKEYTNLDAEI